MLRPRSVTGLLMASFALVALPLLVATLFSVAYVDQLADQSQHLVQNGVQAARAIKRLDSKLTDMERSARQYKILKNPILATRFSDQLATFSGTLATLHNQHLSPIATSNLEALGQQAQIIATAVKAGPQAIDTELSLFDTMHNQTAVINTHIKQFINSELKQLQSTAGDANYVLLLCIVMLIPGVILLSIIFTMLISKPVRQINGAITRLGKGEFNHPVKVSAPSAEFDTLGNRIDWMRQRLATLEQERSQFLRHMSHEIKTPLASIREGADLMNDGTLGQLNPQQAEVMTIIQRNSLELLTLIENLLDFSAWQQQQVKLEYSRFVIREVAADIVRRQKLTIESKQISVSLPDNATMLTADREHVHLIIDNLLTNAVKFSPQSGAIRIQAEANGDCVTISVCDEGPGIPADERSRIFEAFYQGSSTGDTPVRGSGIGLSVVSECVNAHEGHINITTAPGGGTCFQITLPEYKNKPNAH